MKFIKRVIILGIAAMLGTVVYGKFKAAENIVAATATPSTHSVDRSATNPSFTGGIGPVGNPYDTNKPYKKNHY